jgi:putative SOS response-associated peptidase YedK
MCTRYLLLKHHLREVLAKLGLEAPAEFVSRYNIAPGTAIPAVRRKPDTTACEVVALRWGLVPPWARDEDGPGLVNARAESLAAKPSFRDALRSRRCVIPASGFYEWEVRGRARQPWLFRRRDESPFGLAGLWSARRAPGGACLESCTLITTEPNALVRPIHHRMPVMLAPELFGAWLDPGTSPVEALAPLLRPADADAMSASALSPRVNNVRHDDPACLEPAGPADAGPQLSLGI